MKKILITALFCISLLSLTVLGFETVNTYSDGMFSDVDESAWYAADVESAYETGLLQGIGNNLFSPEGKVTLAEAVTIAARINNAWSGAEEIPEATDGESWYAPFVEYAKNNGIVSGEAVDYTKAAERWEIAKLFALALPESWYTAKNDVSEIPDVPETNAYFDELLMLYNAGVIVGNDEFGTFKPEQSITRAEISAIVGRIVFPERRIEKEFTDANYGDAYYLMNDCSIRFSGNATHNDTPWNYDNRNRYATISNNANHIYDYFVDGDVTLWRDIEDVNEGLVGWDFYGSLTVIKESDGIYFRLTDDNKKAVTELITKDGKYFFNGNDTGIEVKTGTVMFNIRADLDDRTASLYINKSYAGDFDINAGTVSRVYIGSSIETVSTLVVNRCDVFRNYLVKENFIRPSGTSLDAWNVTGEPSVAAKGGQTYSDANSALLSAKEKAEKSFKKISGDVVFESYMLFPEAGDAGYVRLKSGDAVVAGFKLNKSGVFTESGTKLRHHTNNIWQCLRMVADTVNNKVTYYINGKEIGAYDFEKYANTVDGIEFGCTSGSAYFDDVTVHLSHEYDDYCPEPESITDDGYNVILNVCSLWHEGTHSGWGAVSGYPDIEPSLGFYDEGIPEVADWEIKYMVENGIDVQHLCWYCPSSNINTPIKRSNLNFALHDGYFYSKYSDMMKFTFMWENNGVNCTNLEQFKEYIWKYWVEYYFTDDRFYSINNKAVFTVWNMNNFKKAFGGTNEGCLEAIEFMNEDIQNYGYDGVMIFFSSNGINKSSYENALAMGADATYAYHYGEVGYSAEKSISRIDTISGFNVLHMIPTFSVGFNNVGWSGERKPIATVEAHREVLDYIIKTHFPKVKKAGWTKWKYTTLVASTWNEYGEGTYIMPCEGLHGFGYLENIAEAVSGVTDHSNNIYPTEQQKARLGHMYPKSKTSLVKLDYEEEIRTVPEERVLLITGADLKQNHGISSYTIDGTVFKATSTVGDSGVYVSKTFSVEAGNVDAIKVKIKSNVATSGTIYFKNDENRGWSENYRFTVSDVKACDQFVEYVVFTDTSTAWKGTIDGLRYDVINAKGSFEVAEIEFLSYADEQKKGRLYFDGTEYKSSFESYFEDGELYICAEPVKGFFSLNNFYYEWSRYTGKLYILTRSGVEFEFTKDSDTVYVDGVAKKLAKPLRFRDGLPYLPMKFIYNESGMSYEIDEKNNLYAHSISKEYSDIIMNRKPYEYEFKLPGDTEGFSVSGATMAVYEDCLHGTAIYRSDQSQKYDARYIIENLSVSTDEYSKVVVGMKHQLAEGVSGSFIEVFFITGTDKSYNQTKSAKKTVVGNASEEFVEYEFDFSANTNWTGEVTGLYIDPISAAGSYAIDYIRIQ